MTVIFCIHYFLWYGAHTAIFGYESVYARHYTNANTVQFGTLKMILPFLSVILTPIICSAADRRRRHRTFFVTALVMAALSMIAYALLPLTMKIVIRQNLSTGANESAYWWFGSPIGTSGDGLLVGPWIYYCLNSLCYEISLATNICLSDSFAVLQAEKTGTSFGRVIVWGTFGWASSAFVLSIINQIHPMPRLLPGLVFSSFLLAVDVVFVSLWPLGADFMLDFIPIEAASSVTGSSSSGHKDPSDYLPSNESLMINLGNEIVQLKNADQPQLAATSHAQVSKHKPIIKERRTKTSLELIKECRVREAIKTKELQQLQMMKNVAVNDNANNNNQSQLMTIKRIQDKTEQNLTTIGNKDEHADSNLNDMVSVAIKTINSDFNPDEKSIGSVKTTVTVSPNNQSQPIKTLTNCATTVSNVYRNTNSPTTSGVIYGLINTPVASEQRQHSLRQSAKKKPIISRQTTLLGPKNFHGNLFTTSLAVQFRLLLLIMRRRKCLIRFFILFILSGFFMSMHWNYFFLYLEQIFHDKFELISALSMVSQSLLGELPFFILSRKFIDYLGRSHAVSVSLISIGLRFLLYQFLLPNANMYFIFVADCLQGPNYGLFYVVMTEIGLEYSYCDNDTIEQMASLGHIDRNQAQQVDALRLALRSTVQSVAFACYEGLGVGLGSLVGGAILSKDLEFGYLWIPMACAAISIGFINILVEHISQDDIL